MNAATIDPHLIAVHFEGLNFTGDSISIAGTDCLGGGITLTGGAWDNRISSTENGCSRIEHYDISSDGVFEGDVEATLVRGGNLSDLSNRTSGILYKGSRPSLPTAALVQRGAHYVPPGRIATLTFSYSNSLGEPVPDADVVFSVGLGSPNAGASGVCLSFRDLSSACTTDRRGRVTFSYRSTVSGPASDTVIAFVDLNSNGTWEGFEPLAKTTVTLAEPLDYFAMGDSYSSGELGTHNTFPPTDLYLDTNPADQVCHRAVQAYSRQLSLPGFGSSAISSDPVASVELRACTGAVTRNIYDPLFDPDFDRPSGAAPLSGPEYEPRQAVSLAAAEAAGDVDMITMSIGGNDMGFADIISQCFVGNGCDVSSFAGDLADTKDGITAVVAEIKAISPGTPIFLVGYPYLAPDPTSSCRALNPWRFGNGPEIDRAEQETIREKQAEFDAAISQHAADLEVHYVSVLAAFAGHEPCGALTDWVEGYEASLASSLWPSTKSFHPNILGHTGYANAIEEYISGLVNSGHALTAAGIPENPAAPTPLATAAATAAATPPPAVVRADITVSSASTTGCDGRLAPGSAFTLSASGFTPGAAITVYENGAVSTSIVGLVADSSGVAEVIVTTGLSDPESATFYEFVGPASATATLDAHSPLVVVSDVAAFCAAADEATTPFGTPVVIDILANDQTDGVIDLTTLVADVASPGASLSVNPVGGAVTYTPPPGFIGMDSFGYEACNVEGMCSATTVVVDVTTSGCTVIGTDGDDVLVGTEGPDVICAGAGSDIIDALGGDDVILAGPGNDLIGAGAGDDEIYGAGGLDEIAAGPGADTTDGGAGPDIIDAGANDTIAPDPEDDVVGEVPPPNDVEPPVITVAVPTEGAVVALDELVAADFVCTDALSAVVACEGTVPAGSPIDTSTLGSHVISVVGMDAVGNVAAVDVTYVVVEASSPPVAQDDNAAVETGESIVVDVLANDLDADDDLDPTSLTVVAQPAAGTAGVVVDADGNRALEYLAPLNEGTYITTYEVCDLAGHCDTANLTVLVVGTSTCTIQGTPGADVLVGTSGDDVICGGGGADTIYGLGGDDLIVAGSGADIVFGGDGHDEIYGGRGNDTIEAGRGNDIVRGGAGADVVSGGRGNDELHGGRGADDLSGNRGSDDIYLGSGHDIGRGNSGNDRIFGRSGSDFIDGGSGNDYLSGGRGADDVDGGPGDDQIRGGKGSDVLSGGGGSDAIRGGRGGDYIAGNSGNDELRGGLGYDEIDGGGGTDSCVGEWLIRCE